MARYCSISKHFRGLSTGRSLQAPVALKALPVLLLCLMLCGKAQAQYDVHFTHYWAVANLYNPAAMNLNDKLNLTGSYALQMAGYTNAPSTMYFGANMVLPVEGKKQAGGVALLNETIGLFTHRRLLLNWSYKLKLGQGWMNVGLQGGVFSEAFDYSDLKTIDSNDPAFPTSDEEGTAFDLGAGLYYRRGPVYAGLAVQHITEPVVTYGKEGTSGVELSIPRSFYFMGGCNIGLRNPLLQLQPTVQMCSELNMYRVDMTCRCNYTYQGNTFYAGLGYSPKTSVTVLLGGKIRGVTVGYAYELFTQGVGALNGSHDLLVSYQMDVDLFKKGRNVHKTVRYL